jgi:glycosyltransferase involved in cell wall biosynthesis
MKNIDASIIIPTCNRKDLLELSLHSFNYQDYMKDRFEVILIDDGSIDGTSDMIKSLKVNYNLIFLRNEQNCGAAYARNLGLQNANGDIIIFSDSDCIVPSNFVSGHLKHHEIDSKICPSATIRWKKVFSNYYENFSNMQKNEFESAIVNITAFKDRLKYLNFNYENNSKILFENDVQEIDKYSYIPSWSEEYLGSIVKSFGANLEHFQYPWILFTTGNVSIRKKHVIDVGGFDERLKRDEDWDLGYRLYKKGIKFACDLKLESTHQEHMIINNREDKMLEAYKIIFNKYKDDEFLLFCLFIQNSVALSTLSNAALEYKILLQNEQTYRPVIHKFNLLLKYRVNSFLAKKRMSEKFINIDNELRIINPISNLIPSFMKIFKELSRIFS